MKELSLFLMGLVTGFMLLWGFNDQLPAKVEFVEVPAKCRLRLAGPVDTASVQPKVFHIRPQSNGRF